MHAPNAAREPVAKRHRPSGLTVFLSAFVAGAVVSFGINHFVDAQLAQSRPQVECEPIFVALRSLPQGAPVTVWDVALKDWPLAMLPTSALRAEDSFEGTVLRYPLREGQPLLAVQLVKAPADHSAIAADVETFKQPMPAATRQAPVVESDAWLPAPKTTSVAMPPAAEVATTSIDSSRTVTEDVPLEMHTEVVDAAKLAGTLAEPFMSADTSGEETPVTAAESTAAETAAAESTIAASTAADPAVPGDHDDPSSLPMVAIADTPVEPALAAVIPEVIDEPAAAEGLPPIEEPLEGVVATDRVATDEPRPFVAAERPRSPVAPQPRLDIAESIAALTRARSQTPAGGPLQVSPDAPSASVLVPESEPRDTEPSPASATGEPLGDAVVDTATASSETATTTSDEGGRVPLPIPRYLVIPERIASEADSFFGPMTPATESPTDTAARTAATTPVESASRPRTQYEAPPVANTPPPTFGEMFPNIANGIDALSGPFRGRSAQQPRRTR